jgi:hypothetical protein
MIYELQEQEVLRGLSCSFYHSFFKGLTDKCKYTFVVQGGFYDGIKN